LEIVMTAGTREVRGTVVPTLRYRDVPAAIAWLCTAFGFEKHLVVTGEDGSVRYAQLAFGDGMVMLGSAEDSVEDRLMAQPEETGGLETQICYLFVADARAHCARSKAAGAEIVLDIDDEASDGRGYSCRDPQGHVWNFGTYDPRQRQSVRRPLPQPRQLQARVRRLALAVGTLANAVTSIAFVGWVCAATEHTLSVAHAGVPAHSGPRDELAATETLERAIREAREQLAREKSGKETAERSARDARELLGREKSAREQAERGAEEAREQLARQRSAAARIEPANDLRAALQAAERTSAEAREQVRALEQAAQKARDEAAAERSGRVAAERTVAEVKDQLGKERGAKEAAERAARQAREQAARQPKKAAPKPKAATGSGAGLSLWQ
jgi:uncharacterized glyoxalase superfamily protein PhnB